MSLWSLGLGEPYPVSALHGRGSGDTQAGFKRAGFVVDAGVNDAAIVSALVPGHAVFFFQHQYATTREPATRRAITP